MHWHTLVFCTYEAGLPDPLPAVLCDFDNGDMKNSNTGAYC